MRADKRCRFMIPSLLAALLIVGAGTTSADTLNSGFVRFYDNGTNGILNLSDGNTWVITFWDLDLNSYSGNLELFVGDRGPGSSWTKFPILVKAHDSGSGGHLLEAWDAEYGSLKSSHALNPGDGSNPVDIRMVISQNIDDTWHISPFFRLDGGEWTQFVGGAFNSDLNFDLTKSMLMLQFATGASGTLVYEPPTALPDNILCDPDPVRFNSAAPVRTVDIDYAGGGSGLIYAYSLLFSWDGSVVTTDSSLVTQGNLLSDQGTTWFEVHSVGADSLIVDCTLLGAYPGVSGPGTMFSIEFTGIACDSSDLDVTVVEVVDNYNTLLTGFSENDALLYVDIADPIFLVDGPFPDGLCYNYTPVLDLSVLDPCSDLDDAFFRVDSGPWVSDAGLFTNYSGGTWANATWSLTGYATLNEGPHLVEFQAFDDFGNPSNVPGWNFIKDTIDPSPATDFLAMPGNGKVHLSWVNPGSDFDHVIVVRKAWDGTVPYGYPEYVQPAVGYPTGPADGDVVYNGIGASYDDVTTDRSIYFYRAFIYDCATNLNGGTAPMGSIPDPFAQGDRSTNYWLGDVTQSGGGGYDGAVDFFDVNALSAGYRRYDSGNPPVAPHDELDVALSDDGSRLGIPVPDDEIDFHELVIFAMNYNVVSPAGKERPEVRLADRGEAGQPILRLHEGAAGENDLYTVSLSLCGNDSQVKAASVLLEYDADVVEWVETRRSDALASANGMTFFQSGLENDGDLWVDLAALGTGEVIHGSGELAEIVFRVKKDGDPAVRFNGADLRNADGSKLYASMDDMAAANGAVPTVTRLDGARPNPFNPTTSIRFELRTSESVSLRVYDVQGRLVRTLLDEARSAGSYTVVWDGRDNSGRSVGSGPYFVRMHAGTYKSTTKVLMLR